MLGTVDLEVSEQRISLEEVSPEVGAEHNYEYHLKYFSA